MPRGKWDVQFKDISVSRVFRYDGNIYIKTEELDCNGIQHINALRISKRCAIHEYFSNNIEVQSCPNIKLDFSIFIDDDDEII